MNDEKIPGRNLMAYPNFDPGWPESWTHDGVGAVKEFLDDVFRYYMLLNQNAQLAQLVTTPVFTEAQWLGVTYLLAFQYENAGNGKGAKVVLKTGEGKETAIDLSGISQKANWNYYEPLPLDQMAAADRSLTVTVHGSDRGGSAGLRITEIIVDVELVALEVKQIQVDEKVYIPSIL